MPNVIKAGLIIADEESLLLQLPSIPAVIETNGGGRVDYSVYFEKRTQPPPGNEGSSGRFDYSVYFEKRPQPPSGDGYSKYYLKKAIEAPESEAVPEQEAAAETKEEDVAAEPDVAEAELLPEDPEPDPQSEAREIVAQAHNEAQEIVKRARDDAARLIDDAQKEEEALKLKHAAEISEAEVKVELAKSIANNIVDDAKKTAESVVAEAEENAKTLYEEAQNSGYAEGHESGSKEGYEQGFAKGETEGKEAGHEEGRKAGRKEGEELGRAAAYSDTQAQMAGELAKASHKAKVIIMEAEEEKTEIISSADSKIVKIAMAVAGKILNKELSENPMLILSIVKEAAQKMADQPRLFITVSTQNYELVSAARDELKKMLGSKQEMTVVADNTFGPADVIVGAGTSGDVDARLETRLAEIKRTIEMVIHQ